MVGISLNAKRNKAAGPVEPTEFVGYTGTSIYAGFYDEDYIDDLNGQDAVEIYEQMRRGDGQIGMILRAIKNPIRSATFAHEATDDDQEELAKFLDWVWTENPFFTFETWLSEALTFLDFGFSIHEKMFTVYEHPDFGLCHVLGGLGFRKQATIERWFVDPRAGLTGVEQYVTGDTAKDMGQHVTIPRENLVLLTNDREGDNYAGISLLRTAYGPWFRKNLFLKLMGIGIEKSSIGTPAGHYPKGVSESDKSKFVAMLANLATHESSYIAYPEGYKVDVFKTDFDASRVKEALLYEDGQISKSILFQFLELGQQGNGGSYALGADQSDLALAAIQFVGNQICRAMYDIDCQLVKWNYGAGVKVPWPRCSGINAKAGSELAEAVKAYTDAGIIRPDDRLEAHLREAMNLPAAEKTREEEGGLGDAADAGVKPDGTKAVAGQTDASGSVADVTLNGAQITAVVDLLKSVATGELPADSARQLLTVAFPISDADAMKILGKIGKGFKPAEPPAPPAPPPARTPAPGKKPEFADPTPGKPWRELTVYEQTLDLAEIARQFETEGQKVTRLLRTELGVVIDKVMRGLEALLKRYPTDRTRAAKELQINTSAIERKLLAAMGDIVAAGAREARAEMAKKLAGGAQYTEFAQKDSAYLANTRGLPKHVRDALEFHAKAQAAGMRDKVGKIVAFGTVVATENEMTNAQILQDMADSLEAYRDSPKLDSAGRTIASQNVNRGRNGFFQENLEDLQAFQYSAILDDRTTDICLSLDGKIMKTGDPDLARFRPPNHHGCRSILVPITVNEPKPTITGIEIDPTNPSLVKEYERRGQEPPDMRKIKKSWNLSEVHS